MDDLASVDPSLRHVCQSCGAELEIRVGFKGKVVWMVPPRDGNFGAAEPELRGEYGDPKLACTADALHPTGFRLVEGELVAASIKDHR